CLQALDLYSF
nr:immunoglobulin light chain junction region [Macaca mulatta]